MIAVVLGIFGLGRSQALGRLAATATSAWELVVQRDTEAAGWVASATHAQVLSAQQAATAQAATTRTAVEQAEALRQARIARAYELAAHAAGPSAGLSERRLLLAIEAVRVTLAAGEPRVPAAEEALREALAGSGLVFRLQHGTVVSALAFSRHGQWLATGSGDGAARLWRVTDPTADPIVLDGHPGSITELVFSPFEHFLAVASEGAVRLSELSHQNLSAPEAAPLGLAGQWQSVSSLAFSPDEHWLVAVASSPGVPGSVRLWDMSAPFAEPLALSLAEKEVISVAFSPDGRWLAAKAMDSSVWLWDVTDLGAPPLGLTGHEELSLEPVFSPDGRWLAAGSVDRTTQSPLIRLWDMASPAAPPMELRGKSGTGDGFAELTSALAFSPDGRWLAMASFGGTLRLWDMNTLTAEPVILPGHAGGVGQVMFSPDGRWLGVTSNDGFASVWDVTDPAAGGKVVLSAQPFHPVALAFSPDGQWLATAGCDQARNESECAKGAAHLLPMASLPVETEPVVLTSPGAEATVLAVSPNGSLLAVGSSDRSLRLWEVAQPFAPPRVLLGSTIGGGISQLVFSPNAEWLAADAGESGVQVWELANPSAPVLVDPFSLGVPAALAFSPDGHWLAQGTSNYLVRLWQVGQWETPPAELSGHISDINPMTFSPDSRWLASGDYVGEVRLWDMTNLAVEPAVLRGDDSPITAMAFSPDAHWLAVITYGREHGRAVQLWAVDNPTQPPIVLSENASDLPLVITGGTDHLAFSQDGRRFAATGCDAGDAMGQCTAGVVRVWDVPNWEAPAAVVPAHESDILGLALSPDGNWLVTAGSDHFGDRARTSNIRLWDTTNPAEPVILPSSARVAHSVAFSPDGGSIAAGGCEQVAAHGACITGGVRLWHHRLEDLIDLACRTAGRNFTRSEWEQFFLGETYRKTCDQWPVGE